MILYFHFLFVRVSASGDQHWIHILQCKEDRGEVRLGERISFPADVIPGVIQVLQELQGEIQAYKREEF